MKFLLLFSLSYIEPETSMDRLFWCGADPAYNKPQLMGPFGEHAYPRSPPCKNPRWTPPIN
jgi:hypothetical protein